MAGGASTRAEELPEELPEAFLNNNSDLRPPTDQPLPPAGEKTARAIDPGLPQRTLLVFLQIPEIGKPPLVVFNCQFAQSQCFLRLCELQRTVADLYLGVLLELR